jgi:hypothetical protein
MNFSKYYPLRGAIGSWAFVPPVTGMEFKCPLSKITGISSLPSIVIFG